MTSDPVQRIVEALSEIARVASVMVDGDEARRILTARAMVHIAHPDPEYRFLSADYYDVDHDTFLRMKKTLLRLERLTEVRCCSALWIPVEGWVPVEGQAGYVTLAVQNGSVHRYYRFGQARMETPHEIARCFESKATVVAPLEHPSETITVLAPVLDSLGDVAGVVELSASHPDTRSLAPAWS
jgi:hypothetical protein